MGNLKVKYLDLNLRNPLIVGSSTLTKTIDGLLKAQEAGAGAVVLKSLFEEELTDDVYLDNVYHPEAYEFHINDACKLYGSSKYIDFIKKARSELFIPVIASVNCLGGKWWVDFAKEIENAGAAAIELNVAYIPFSVQEDSASIEKRYVSVVEVVKKAVNIPVSVKIGHYFTSIPLMVKKIKEAGADGVVMFNKFLRIGIDIENMKFTGLELYSCIEETYEVLRYVGVCSSQINIDIAASTGIHNYNIALQHMMAGAKVFQMVSAIYKYDYEIIKKTLQGINDFLDRKNIENVSDIIGRAASFDEGFRAFERMQYMKSAGDRY